eukprot:152499-Pyramimonas_sp.AAC.1
MATPGGIVGDMNAQNQRWLLHSHSNALEGKELQHGSGGMGLVDKVGRPTRGANVLDLVFLRMLFRLALLARFCRTSAAAELPLPASRCALLSQSHSLVSPAISAPLLGV